MEFDDWLFSSIKQYKNLSMYDVHQQVTAFDIVDGTSLCVATTSKKRHELMELLLPDKLLETEQEGKLVKSRDFRVNCGGLCDGKVSTVKHIPKTRLCAIAEENQRNTITVLEMGTSDTDLMQHHRTFSVAVKNDLPVHICPSKYINHHLTFGSTINNLTIVDVHSNQVVADSSGCKDRDPVSSFHSQSPDILTCCTVKGDICVLDFRCSDVKSSTHKNSGKSASFWTMSCPTDQSDSLLQLSNCGEVLSLDQRCLSESVASVGIPMSTDGNFEYLTIQESPKGDRFSVSGFDGLVYLFDCVKRQPTVEHIEPVFKHEGHVMESEDQSESLKVVQHMWHPWQQNLIISCADNGSIHAWESSVDIK